MAADRRLLVLLCVTMLTNAVSMGAFPPLLPEVGSAGRLPDWQLGVLAGAFGLARTIADLPIGMWVRRDLRTALLAAPMVLIAGALCLGTAGHVLLLIFGRALMGAGHALAIVAGLTAILQYRAVGRLAASLNAFEFSAIVGMLGGVMLVGALPSWLGWNAAYLVACAPLLVGLALVPSVLRSLAVLDAVAENVAATAPHPAGVSVATTPDPAGVSDATAPDPPGASDPARMPPSQSACSPAAASSIPAPLAWPDTITRGAALAFVAGATVALSYSTLEQFVIPLRGSREFGLDRAGIASLLAIAQFCDLLVILPLGVLADRYRPPRVLAPVLVAVAAAVVAITFGGFTLVLVGCVLFGLGMAGWMLPLSLLRQETPAARVAWRAAVYRVGVDAGLFLGPFLSGLLGEQGVGLLTVLFAAVLIGTAAMLFSGRAGAPPSPERASKLPPGIFT